MNPLRTVFFGLLLLTLTLNACGPLRGTAGESGPAVDLPDDVKSAAKEALSARTGAPDEEINVVAVQKKEWPDACLGLGREGEMCAQVITPGWKVKLRANGEEYILHTDEEGSAIRMEEASIGHSGSRGTAPARKTSEIHPVRRRA